MTQKKWDTPRLFPLREGTLAVSHGDTFGGGAAIAAATSGCSTGSNPGSKTGPDCTNGYNAAGVWLIGGGECQQGFSATFKLCNNGLFDLLG